MVGLPSDYVLVRKDQKPPSLKAMFNGWVEKLTYFLNLVWNHLEWHRAAYPDEVACVNIITSNLKGADADPQCSCS